MERRRTSRARCCSDVADDALAATLAASSDWSRRLAALYMKLLENWHFVGRVTPLLWRMRGRPARVRRVIPRRLTTVILNSTRDNPLSSRTSSSVPPTHSSANLRYEHEVFCYQWVESFGFAVSIIGGIHHLERLKLKFRHNVILKKICDNFLLGC